MPSTVTPPAQITVWVGMPVPSSSSTPAVGDRLDHPPQPQLHASAVEGVGGIAGGRRLERGQQPVQSVDQHDPGRGPREPEAVVADGHVQQLGQGAGHLHPGGPTPDDDEGEGALGRRGPIGVGLLESPEDVVTESAGVGERVEGEAELRCSRECRRTWPVAPLATMSESKGRGSVPSRTT